MFTSDSDFTRADWRLLQNGAVSLFLKPTALGNALREFVALGYEIADISCGAKDPDFQAQMSHLLRWKDQFGYEPWNGNLNALSDGVRDFPSGPAGCSALVLNGFHHLVAADNEYAHAILDILEFAARDHLLRGKFLVVLVQTDDAAYDCPPVGCRTVTWNRQEWMDADRGS